MIATRKAASSPLSAFSNMRAYMGECMERKYCVYCHTSPDGRRYIGVTCRKPEKRWNYGNGYKENSYFTRSIEKYGWGNFKHEILCEGLTRQGASWLEKKFIEFYGTTDRAKGFNLELGGLNGDKELSDETKRKIGDSHRGRYTEAQWAATIARRGKGFPHTEEAKKKIGDAHRGKHLSEEHKKKLSEAHKGKMPSAKNLEILRNCNIKSVDQFDINGNFIARHSSIRGAACTIGIKEQNISACCRGKTKSAGNFVWKYAV